MNISEFLYIINTKLIEDRKLNNIDNKSHLVIHKQVETPTSFTAIKVYKWEITLYSKQQNQTVLTVSKPFNTSKVSLEVIEKELTTETISKLLEILITDYNKLLNNNGI
jgi:hypothetical protein